MYVMLIMGNEERKGKPKGRMFECYTACMYVISRVYCMCKGNS